MFEITHKHWRKLALVAGIAGTLILTGSAWAQNGGGLGRTVGGVGNAVGRTVGAVGGAVGANVGVNANVGPVGVNSNTSLNSNGLTSDTSVNVGTAATANINASATAATGVNADVSVNVPSADPAAPGVPGTPSGTAPGTSVNVGNVAAQLSGMSRSQRIALKKRCSLILGASDDYDADLIKLCRMLARL